MKTLLLTLVACSLLGAGYLTWGRPEPYMQFPLPGPGLSIHIPVEHQGSGTFFLDVWMPKVGSDLHVVDETQACEFSFRVDAGTPVAQNYSVHQLVSYGEFGWAHVARYRAGPDFHLGSGEHSVDIAAGASCPAASTRGSVVSVARDEDHPTERFLLESLLTIVSKVALFGGLGALALILGSRKIWAT